MPPDRPCRRVSKASARGAPEPPHRPQWREAVVVVVTSCLTRATEVTTMMEIIRALDKEPPVTVQGNSESLLLRKSSGKVQNELP
jgi:hypothetical protein